MSCIVCFIILSLFTRVPLPDAKKLFHLLYLRKETLDFKVVDRWKTSNATKGPTSKTSYGKKTLLKVRTISTIRFAASTVLLTLLNCTVWLRIATM